MTGTRKPLLKLVCAGCRGTRLEVHTGPDGRMVLLHRGGRKRIRTEAPRKAWGEADWRFTAPPVVQETKTPVVYSGPAGQEHDELVSETVTLRACKCDLDRAIPTDRLRELLATGRRVTEVTHNGLLA